MNYRERLGQGHRVVIHVFTLEAGGYAFQLRDANRDGQRVWVSTSGRPFDTLEEAMVAALLYPDCPDVAELLDERSIETV